MPALVQNLRYAMVEAASWRLASEFASAHCDRVRLLSSRTFGAHYDVITVATRNVTPHPLVHINRAGSIQVVGRFDRRPVEYNAAGRSWDEYLRSDPRDFLRALEKQAGLPAPHSNGYPTREALVYRLLAALINAQMLSIQPWTVHCGWTSGPHPGYYEAGFEAIPGANSRRSVSLIDDPYAIPETRFWFVGRDQSPLLCFEISGRCWDASGSERDVMRIFEKEGRHVWRTLTRIAGSYLP